MYTRLPEPPRTAFFLFGPRGTGKSTWLRARFEKAHVFNLLTPESTVRYEREPALFRAGIRALESGVGGAVQSWIVYRGDKELEVDGTRVLPVEQFLRRLHDGEILA